MAAGTIVSIYLFTYLFIYLFIYLLIFILCLQNLFHNKSIKMRYANLNQPF